MIARRDKMRPKIATNLLAATVSRFACGNSPLTPLLRSAAPLRFHGTTLFGNDWTGYVAYSETKWPILAFSITKVR